MAERGILFLVAGPSGVGKDSLIAGARARLAADGRYVFPKRVITRPKEAGGEDHEAATAAAFEQLEAAGTFMLSWRAHGHGYGIPRDAEDALAAGRSVVVNISRQVIDQARLGWLPVRVLLISAPRDILRTRLEARGRESDADIRQRLDRADSYRIEGDDVRVVMNDGRLEQAVGRFVDLLEREVRDLITARETETARSE